MSFTLRLMAFVKDRPGVWIPATAFEQFGRQAWRSRISDARQKFEAAKDGTIENRQRIAVKVIAGTNDVWQEKTFKISEYRYMPEGGSLAPAEPESRGANLNDWSLR